jgi:hypothetical protein
LLVRLAAFGALLIAILSMGVTIHVAGGAGMIPVFAIGLAFPLLQRFLPGRLMLYLTFLGWLALSQLPVFDNVLPTRLMVYFYLLAGLLLAVFVGDMMARRSWFRALSLIGTAVALIPLIPILPYPSSPEPVPTFFTGGSAARIPAGSVALVVPLSLNTDGRAMLWQAAARMQFRMPEGYAIIPGKSPTRSPLIARVLATAAGEPNVLTDNDRQLMLSELAGWKVTTVIVGPMSNELQEVQLFTFLLSQEPQQIEGVYVWWGADARQVRSCPSSGQPSDSTPGGCDRSGAMFTAGSSSNLVILESATSG